MCGEILAKDSLWTEQINAKEAISERNAELLSVDELLFFQFEG